MRRRPTVAIGLIGALFTSLFAACAPPSRPRAADDHPEPATSRAEPDSEPVRFACGDNVLAGVLHFPQTRGPHPAVAMVLGSGRQDRTYGGTATALARHFT